jgi:hypothetical protein
MRGCGHRSLTRFALSVAVVPCFICFKSEPNKSVEVLEKLTIHTGIGFEICRLMCEKVRAHRLAMMVPIMIVLLFRDSKFTEFQEFLLLRFP